MIRGLLWFLLFLGGIHASYLFGGPFVKNRMLEAKMKDIARNPGMRQEREIRRDVMAFVHEKGISMAPNQLQVTVNERGIIIAARYDVHVELLFVERDYEFFPASNPAFRMKPLRRRAG